MKSKIQKLDDNSKCAEVEEEVRDLGHGKT